MLRAVDVVCVPQDCRLALQAHSRSRERQISRTAIKWSSSTTVKGTFFLFHCDFAVIEMPEQWRSVIRLELAQALLFGLEFTLDKIIFFSFYKVINSINEHRVLLQGAEV